MARRSDFEYALKRRAARASDYLRYIRYEWALEELRRHRRRERGIGGKPGLADHCLVRRVHFIYERLLRKFRWVGGWVGWGLGARRCCVCCSWVLNLSRGVKG